VIYRLFVGKAELLYGKSVSNFGLEPDDRFSLPVTLFNGRFDTFPEIVFRLLVRKELLGCESNGLQVLIEAQAIVLAGADVGVIHHICAGTDKLRELALKFLAGHRP
jgi:hypothetical protein